jgi:hypothetical protein
MPEIRKCDISDLELSVKEMEEEITKLENNGFNPSRLQKLKNSLPLIKKNLERAKSKYNP